MRETSLKQHDVAAIRVLPNNRIESSHRHGSHFYTREIQLLDKDGKVLVEITAFGERDERIGLIERCESEGFDGED